MKCGRGCLVVVLFAMIAEREAAVFSCVGHQSAIIADTRFQEQRESVCGMDGWMMRSNSLEIAHVCVCEHVCVVAVCLLAENLGFI